MAQKTTKADQINLLKGELKAKESTIVEQSLRLQKLTELDDRVRADLSKVLGFYTPASKASYPAPAVEEKMLEWGQIFAEIGKLLAIRNEKNMAKILDDLGRAMRTLFDVKQNKTPEEIKEKGYTRNAGDYNEYKQEYM